MEKGKMRERRQARTREAFIQAAAEVIETQGVDALNMRVVAERVDYSASNLYEYFSGKDELLAAVIKEALTCLTTHVRQRSVRLSPRERLQSYGRMYLEFAQTHPQLYLLIFGHKGAVRKLVDMGEALSPYDLLQEIVEEGIVAGAFVARVGFGVHEMTFGCWSLVHGIAMLRLTASDVVGKTSEGSDEQILACFVEGLSKG